VRGMKVRLTVATSVVFFISHFKTRGWCDALLWLLFWTLPIIQVLFHIETARLAFQNLYTPSGEQNKNNKKSYSVGPLGKPMYSHTMEIICPFGSSNIRPLLFIMFT
jgi:hypothetical protein